MISKQLRGHTILPQLISADGFVIDAGAHRGEFSAAVSMLTGARVLALEPNQELWDGHDSDERIDNRSLALGAERGVAKFHLSTQKESSSLLVATPGKIRTIDVAVVTLEGILDECKSEVDCLKLDIEGAECEVLLSSPDYALQACKQITVEFHDFMYPNLLEKVYRCKERLHILGFECLVMSRKTHEDVLFVRGDIASEMIQDLWVVRSFEKYARGLSRVMRRYLGANTRL